MSTVVEKGIPLTTRQRAIYEFICGYIRVEQCSPTVREIGKEFGISSPNGVICHLRGLERKGYIRRRRLSSRGIFVLAFKDVDSAEAKPSRCLSEVFREVERLIRVDAHHRKGFRISEATPDFIFGQAAEEFFELENAEGEVEELHEFGDLIGVLVHYAIKRGWTEEQVTAVILDKFKQRFMS